VEIINRCNNFNERIFYTLYAAHLHLKAEELRRCIVNQTFESLLSKEKQISPAMLTEYPNAQFMLKDKLFLDFLGLKPKHNEHQLHSALLEHMKQFILELGKDFLYMDTEYPVMVGGKQKRIDLLFYHRALQCLVAIELKSVDFEAEFVSKLDLYLEALDRDYKRPNENPSLGIILCPSADKSEVEYTLSRSISPTMVAEYRRQLIPLDVMRRSLAEYCEYLKIEFSKPQQQ
jgi:predicted nuclease of restriction endonuclease-like (RecB) superfamily